MNPCWVVVYAWSPLVVREFANAGHYDALPVLLTMLALKLHFRQRKLLSSLSLALGTLSKFFSGILLPIWGRGWRPGHWLAFGLILGLGYVPFLLWDQASLSEIFAGLNTYNAYWSYNSSVFAVIQALYEAFLPQWSASLFPGKLTAGLLFLAVWMVLIAQTDQRPHRVLHRTFTAIAVLFIINPVGDPWYYCWVMPFLCFLRYRSWLLLSHTLVLSYWNFQSDAAVLDQTILSIPILNWIIYTPVFALLAYELFRERDRIESLFPETNQLSSNSPDDDSTQTHTLTPQQGSQL
jgi:hypothetical protein